MNNVFWIGVYPGLDTARLDYVIDVFHRLTLAV
jgi:dTDP-4-amino-4,6-dideoxygalactose transaminase